MINRRSLLSLLFATPLLLKRAAAQEPEPEEEGPASQEEAPAAGADEAAAPPAGKDMRPYRCRISQYLYDPLEGEPPRGVPAGTAFADLPADWNCPDCGSAMTEFEPELR